MEDRAIRSMFLRDVKSTIRPSRILQQKKYGKKLHSIRVHDEVEGLVQKETCTLENYLQVSNVTFSEKSR